MLVVFDIDGTLANIEHRLDYVRSKPKNWKAFDREDWHFLLDMLDKNAQTWYTRRVREKLLEACHG